MFKNYFKTAFKNLRQHKMYSAINIAGLTIGLWACMIVATVVVDDLSYDRQWSRGNDLYRIVSVNKMGDGLFDRFGSSFAGLAPALQKNYPEVETFSEFASSAIRLKMDEADENGTTVASLNADTGIWKMLDIKVVAGNPKKHIDGSNNLLISESFRDKYLKGQDPIGKIFYDVPSYENKPNAYLITGVIKDIPANTHLRADVIKISKGRIEELNPKQYGSFTQNYILMRPGTDMKKFTAKVNNWYKSFITADKPYQYDFQPMKDIYLHSSFAVYQKVKGSMQNSYIFSGVALLLLLIACVNFINLSTARATTRLRETGVRKILGATKRQIIFQFLSEAILFFALSAVFAMLLYQLSLQPVESYLGHNLAQTILSRSSLFAIAFCVILLVSIFTGIYPAWLISGFKPANTLKGRLFSGKSYGQSWLRKSLVVLQFSISIVVLLSMIVMQQQLKFMENTDIGFNKNNLLSIGFVSWDGKGEAFKNELMKLPAVVSASTTAWMPSQGAGYMSREVDDPNHPGNKLIVWYISGDINFARTIGLRLHSGRLLSKEFGTDAISEDSLMRLTREQYDIVAQSRACLVTAATAKILNITALNSPLKNIKTVPVGIVEDFHNQSLRDLIGPTVIIAEPNMQYGGMLIRVTPGTETQVTASLQKLWRQFYPAKLLETNRVDELLAKQYEAESKLRQLFTFFSMLTMALAALGIFGLIVHTAQQRVKEIGIRKVLGASVVSIARLLSSDFLKLVLLSIIVASPVGSYIMNKWLQDFAYRIHISWWMFIIAGITAVVIALVTVSFQAIKAALANPVKSLRTE